MDWNSWEHNWRDEWAPKLTNHVALASDVHDFIGQVATHDQIVNARLTETLALERHLLRRLGEEYRSIDLLATNGHGLQAMSLCASLFELAHTLGYIVNNDTAARQWLSSKDRERVPWKIRKVVVWNGNNLGWDKTRCDEEYARYGFACGFKHHNPVFARVSNLPVDPDLYCAQFALAEGANLGLVSSSLVALFRFDAHQCSATLTVANALLDRAAALLPHINDRLPPSD